MSGVYGFEPIPANASTDIVCSVFVKLNSSGQWVTCTTQGEYVHGVSSDAALNAPIPQQTTQYAGEADKPMHVFRPGEIALVLVGSGGTTAGSRVMTSTAGKAIAATTTNYAAGVALETAVENEYCRVRIEPSYYA